MSKQALINRARELGVARFTKLSPEELAAAVARAEEMAAKNAAAKARQEEREAAEAAAREQAREVRRANAERRAQLDLTSTYHWGEEESYWSAGVVRRAQKDIDEEAHYRVKFLAGVESDPVHALSWADSYFKAAAKGKVAAEMLVAWKAGHTDEELKRFAAENLRRHVIGGRSTSVSSNHVDQCMAEAWVDYTTEYLF